MAGMSMSLKLGGLSRTMRDDPDMPTNVVVILRDGRRIAIELRRIAIEGIYHIWQPIIEGDIRRLMPDIVAMDADYWPYTAAIRFDEQLCDEGWGEAIAANSSVIGLYRPVS